MTAQVWFIVGAVIAATVAVIFAKVGDGVRSDGATGVPALLLRYAHTAVWALLCVAFVIAAVAGRWQAWSGLLAAAAGLLYLAFLSAVVRRRR